MKDLLDDDQLREMLRRAAANVPPGPTADDLLHRLQEVDPEPQGAMRRPRSYLIAAGFAAAAVLALVLAQGSGDTDTRSVIAADPTGDAAPPASTAGAPFPATVDTSRCPADVQAAFDGVSFSFSELERLESSGGDEEHAGLEYHPSSGILTAQSTRDDATSFSGWPRDHTLIDPETGEPVGEGELLFDAVLYHYDIPAGGSVELPVSPPVGHVEPGEYGLRVVYNVLKPGDEAQRAFCTVVIEAERVVLR